MKLFGKQRKKKRKNSLPKVRFNNRIKTHNTAPIEVIRSKNKEKKLKELLFRINGRIRSRSHSATQLLCNLFSCTIIFLDSKLSQEEQFNLNLDSLFPDEDGEQDLSDSENTIPQKKISFFDYIFSDIGKKY